MDAKHFDFWCRKVIINKGRNYLRDRNRRWQYEAACEEHGWNDRYFVARVSLGDLDVDITDGILHSAIDGLNESRKTIVIMYYFIGYTDKEMGELLNIPRTTVHYNRKRALHTLRKTMEAQYVNTEHYQSGD